MHLTSKLLAALAVLALLIAACAHADSPRDYDMSRPDLLTPGQLYAESALLIDEDSGETLLNKNARVRMYPASTTKIMTLLLGLESGIGLDEKITIPSEAADVPSDSSLIPVKPGDEMTFRDLLYGFMLSSGNDGANAVAVLADGSLDAFVDRMNRRAEEIGCEGTHYANPSGYHDDDHYTAARDLALIARTAMQNPTFRDIVGRATWDITVTRRGKTRTGTIISRNSLLQSGEKYYYPDCTGIKTGHHRRAGWCFVGSAERDGKRVICVVMKCETQAEGWYDAARLFEYGFTRYEPVSADALLSRAISGVRFANASEDDARGGAMLPGLANIDAGGAEIQLPMDSEIAMDAAVQRVADSIEIKWSRPLEAPVEAGETLGMLTATLPGGETVTATLTASRAIAAQQPVETPAPTAPPAPQAPDETGRAATGSKKPGIVPILLGAIILFLALALVLHAISVARQRRRRARRRAAARRRRLQNR